MKEDGEMDSSEEEDDMMPPPPPQEELPRVGFDLSKRIRGFFGGNDVFLKFELGCPVPRQRSPGHCGQERGRRGRGGGRRCGRLS